MPALGTVALNGEGVRVRAVGAAGNAVTLSRHRGRDAVRIGGSRMKLRRAMSPEPPSWPMASTTTE
jgi:hypothetical protein